MLLGGSIVKPLFILNLGFGDSLFLVEVILTDSIAVVPLVPVFSWGFCFVDVCWVGCGLYGSSCADRRWCFVSV